VEAWLLEGAPRHAGTPPVIVTARKPRPRRLLKTTAGATPAFPASSVKPRAGMEITTEEHTRPGDAANALFRELARRATGA
jgi:hypothetical protein